MKPRACPTPEKLANTLVALFNDSIRATGRVCRLGKQCGVRLSRLRIVSLSEPRPGDKAWKRVCQVRFGGRLCFTLQMSEGTR